MMFPFENTFFSSNFCLTYKDIPLLEIQTVLNIHTYVRDFQHIKGLLKVHLQNIRKTHEVLVKIHEVLVKTYEVLVNTGTLLKSEMVTK